jgi:type I restriction enzyme M protein
MTGTGGLQRVPRAFIENFEIPLPPIEVQKEIVGEIEGYQKVIDGARAVLDNYRPHIPIHPEWPMVELGEICKPEYGFTEKAAEQGDARFIRITDIAEDGTLRPQDWKFVTLTDEARDSLLKKGDILVARTGATFGKTMLFDEDYQAVFASFLIRLRFTVIFPQFHGHSVKTVSPSSRTRRGNDTRVSSDGGSDYRTLRATRRSPASLRPV